MANEGHFAVVVGINRYPGISHLECSRGDAVEFARWLIDPNGGNVPEKQIHLIVADLPADANPRDAVPTRIQIREKLRECMDAAIALTKKDINLWQSTRLYYYYSGHGIAPSVNDAALLAANATKVDMTEHLSAKHLLEYFVTHQWFREVIVFADCCRDSLQSVTPTPNEWHDEPRNYGAVSHFFAAGTRHGKKSFEEPADEGQVDGNGTRRGYFTRALLDGLWGGAAVGAKGGKITNAELIKYMRNHMAKATENRALGPLGPDFPFPGQEDIIFRIPTKLPSLRVHLVGAAPVGLRMEGGPENEIYVGQPDGAGNFDFELPVGVYEALSLEGDPPVPVLKGWFCKVSEGSNHHEFI